MASCSKSQLSPADCLGSFHLDRLSGGSESETGKDILYPSAQGVSGLALGSRGGKASETITVVNVK